MNDGIAIILDRMGTHPEEFYDDGGKWKFIYKEYFRDVMTEEEKAALHTKLKEVRREELTSRVMKALTRETFNLEEYAQVEDSAFASAPIKREGSKVAYEARSNMVKLNAQQLAIARDYASREGVSIHGAIKKLGYA